ncbi:MAG: DUF1553 domain-containing protein [Opitutaceae bacterium]|nr:DUF1553 domain-containing protein [Opitutaceae bacterium]
MNVPHEPPPSPQSGSSRLGRFHRDFARWTGSWVVLTSLAVAEPAPDFNRDVRPILSNHCFHCHGPDAGSREAGLRFDIPEPDGGFAFVPGRVDQSEAFKRIASTDPEEQMPPPHVNKPLSAAQVAVLQRWVAAGAPYQAHWSLVAPKATAPPAVSRAEWVRNTIDHFVLASLERNGLQPAPEAAPHELLRRVTLDLTGLPPTPAELDAFLADRSPDAYPHVVRRLLASPHFGERMALDWLDLARYADTNGYFGDATRQIWPWRDWVVQSFNRNLPYDQFTVDQLAGDLLTAPTPEQRIATGFSRNSMVNNESGAIDEEFRVEYVAERTETVGTVWLGLTVGCARCHDHKYDPISQKDFYQLYAFFNNSPEKGLVTQDNPPPEMDVATPAQRAELEALIAARRDAETALNATAARIRDTMMAWEQTATHELTPPDQNISLHAPFEPETPGLEEKGSVTFTDEGLVGRAAVFDGMQHIEATGAPQFMAEKPWSVGLWLQPTGSLSGVLARIEPTGRRRGFEIVWQKGRFQINLVSQWGASAIELVTREPTRPAAGDWQQLIVSYDGSSRATGFRVYLDGRPVAFNIVRDRLDGPTENAEPLRLGRRDSGLGFYGRLDELRLLARAVDDADANAWFWSDRLRGPLARTPESRTDRDRQYLLDYYLARHGDTAARAVRTDVQGARAAEANYRARLPKTLIMQDLPEPRATHLLKRGKYDDPGERVAANVPAVLPPLPAEAPRNRLGLARWLVSRENPLTARVAVNRLWMQVFGEGLVRTPNDFGAQGEHPTHPELLDWLSVRFMDSGWNIKALLELIVTSATYRQSSVPTVELLAQDPDNRRLARGPRFRLPAEVIRDQALATSGLLVPKLGGPSVRPYQPDGLWEAVTYDGEVSYQQDRGEDLWRRSLYTFWKRQAPPPALLTFDSPTRETCVVNRPRTNTPLQALTLLNDVTFVEAGRALAADVLNQPGDDHSRLQTLFRRVTARRPDDGDHASLLTLLGQQRKRFRTDPAAAVRYIASGESPAGRHLDPVEVAAWSVTAHAVLCLDEAITRR